MDDIERLRQAGKFKEGTDPAEGERAGDGDAGRSLVGPRLPLGKGPGLKSQSEEGKKLSQEVKGPLGKPLNLKACRLNMPDQPVLR